MPAKSDVSMTDIVRAYKQTRSIDKTAAVVGVSRTTVKRRLVGSGFRLLGPLTIDKDRKEKRCHQCKQVRDIECFHKCRSRGDGRSATCRKCWAEYQSAHTLKRKFGMTPAQYAELLEKQRGTCAICPNKVGLVRVGKKLRLAVDHCHKTGKVRGLLCGNCNNGLGRFKDDPSLLERAAKYLRNEGVT